MRINQMITKEKMLCPFITFSQLISKEMYEYGRGEFVCVYCGLKVDGPITDCSSRYFCRFLSYMSVLSTALPPPP